VAVFFCTAPGAKAAVTLFDLLQPNTTIVNGNLEFLNFRNATQSGNLLVDWDGITVDPIVGGPGTPETEFGLRFSSAQWTLIGPDMEYELSLHYNVRTLSGAFLISDNTLEVTGGSIPDGSLALSEGVYDTLGNPLVTNLVFFGSSGQNVQDHQVFSGGPYAELEVRTELLATNGEGANSRVFASHFDQSFSQIPESGPAILIAFSALLYLHRVGRSRSRAGG
jgi:hypothetical protein